LNSGKKPLFDSFFTKKTAKGFLFTISVILFASTLVFFAQSFSSINGDLEKSVFLQLKPLQVVSMQDDISTDLLNLFDLSFDVNYGATKLISVSGIINYENTISADVDNYSSFLSSTFFPRLAGQESLSVSEINEGSFEAFFGTAVEFDYNYDSNTINFHNIGSASTLESIDMNLFSEGTITSYSWSENAGDMEVEIYYYDDSNYLHFSKSLDSSESSSLTINYSNGSVVLYFGLVDTTNGNFKIVSSAPYKLEYNISCGYSGTPMISPVRSNVPFVYSASGLTYSNKIILLK